jgi:hypothetical protein
MFKPILENAEEIADFVIKFAVHQIDEELVMEYFFGCKAILKSVPIDTLIEGDKNQHIASETNEKKYKKLSIETMPPLLIENLEVIDGNHRLRIAKRNGLKEIKVYDIVTIEE